MVSEKDNLNGMAKKSTVAKDYEDMTGASCVIYHQRLMECQDAMVQELKEISAVLAELVTQQAKERKELLEELLGRTPRGYVPLVSHFITIAVALGVSQTANIVSLFWGHK